MRAVVQRVSSASVVIAGEVVGSIERGLLVYVAAAPDDGQADVDYIADKVAHMRVFEDAQGKVNLDVSQVGGSVLIVSAFSVHADLRKGRRPSFDSSARADIALPLIDAVIDAIRAAGLRVETGRFGADMAVNSVNDGPICALLDSQRLF